MNLWRQIFAITWLNIKNISGRWGSSLVAVVGAVGVVAVLTTALAMTEGFNKTMEAAGQVDNAIIMRSGASTELSSGLWRNAIEVIRTAPGIAKLDGRSLVAPQLMVILDVPKRSTGTNANVPLRGVTEEIYAILSEIKIVEGRRPEAGKRELMVGLAAKHEFVGLELGSTVGSGANTWTVVGIFSDNGSVRESEIWADAVMVQEAYRRGNSYNSVLVKLETPASFSVLADALTNDPRLGVTVQRETDYYAAQADALKTFITLLGYTVVSLMAIGAIFASLNSMYSAIASRSREIAILRTLGFGALPVVVSVLIESVFLTLIGGAVGCGLAYLLFNGMTVSTLNTTSFSQVTFAFTISPEIIYIGVSLAVVIGLIAGLLPSMIAARSQAARVHM